MILTLLALACAHPPASTAAILPSDGQPGGVVTVPGLSETPVGLPQVPGAVPPPDSPPTPPLAGTTEAVVLEGLTHNELQFTVGADLTPLSRIDQSQAQLLASHLAAHPQWRVTRWEGATVAFLRTEDPELGRTVGWAGYHHDADSLWRALLRLSPRLPGAEWTNSPLVDHFSADNNVLAIHAFQPAGKGWYDWRGVAIQVDGKVASLEIHELSRQLELDATSAAMKWITTDLLHLDMFTQDIQGELPPWAWLAPGEPTSDPAGITTVVTKDGVDLHGRLNPGRAGWTWARITGPGGRAWLEQLTAAATLERIGWSKDEDQRFWFQGRVPTELAIPAGSVVEVWFLADGLTQPQQLGRWGTGI